MLDSYYIPCKFEAGDFMDDVIASVLDCYGNEYKTITTREFVFLGDKYPEDITGHVGLLQVNIVNIEDEFAEISLPGDFVIKKNITVLRGHLFRELFLENTISVENLEQFLRENPEYFDNNFWRSIENQF